jgi:hypothetical protein
MSIRWFYYLVPGTEEQAGRIALLDVYPATTGTLIICRDNGNKQFARFLSFLDYGKFYFRETLPENRTDFEVIMGNNFQKPYFDIDIQRNEVPSVIGLPSLVRQSVSGPMMSLKDANQAVTNLVSIIKSTIEKLGDKNGTILVFTSHSADKLSYHVIVDGWCVADQKENKAFHDLIMKDFPEQCIVDHSVYSSVRQLRMYKSRKYQSDRIKILSQELTINIKTGLPGYQYPVVPDSEDHGELMILSSALVGNTTVCNVLPSLYAAPPKHLFVGEKHELSEENIEAAIELAREKIKFFPFTLIKVEDTSSVSTLILLKRNNSSYCETCKRSHEHENPYLIICGEDNSIYFDCRRNVDGKRLYVGKLGTTKTEESTTPTLALPRQHDSVIGTPRPTTSIFEDLQKMRTSFAAPQRTPKQSSLSSDSLSSFKAIYFGTV